MNKNKRLQMAREQLNLTQQKVANDLNISRSKYAYYENTAINIPIFVFNYFNIEHSISLSWLLTGDGFMFGRDETSYPNNSIYIEPIVTEESIVDYKNYDKYIKQKNKNSKKYYIDKIIMALNEDENKLKAVATLLDIDVDL